MDSRAHSAISKRLGILVSEVKNVIIWGNHSNTQFPDASNVSVYNSLLYDTQWIENEFIEVSLTIQQVYFRI